MTIRTRLMLVEFLCMHLPLMLLIVFAVRGGIYTPMQVVFAALIVTLLGAALLLMTIIRALRPLRGVERALRDHSIQAGKWSKNQKWS